MHDPHDHEDDDDHEIFIRWAEREGAKCEKDFCYAEIETEMNFSKARSECLLKVGNLEHLSFLKRQFLNIGITSLI